MVIMLFVVIMVIMLFVVIMVIMVIMLFVVIMLFMVIMLFVVIMVIILMLFKRNWHNPSCGHNHRPVKRGCFGQPFQPAFEFQSVHEQYIGLSHRPCSFWRWLVNVGVPIRSNKRCQFDMLTSDTLYHIP